MLLREWRNLIAYRWEKRGQPRYYLEVIDGQPWVFPDRGGLQRHQQMEEFIDATKEYGRAF